jgi:uncharacterized protein
MSTSSPSEVRDAPALRDQAPIWHTVRSDVGVHLLAVAGSKLFDIDESFARALENDDPAALAAVTSALYDSDEQASLDVVPYSTTPQAISLNVSSACNLGCSYCYAGGGRFGGAQRSTMSWETARAAVDRLVALSDSSVPITIGFMGGEPFMNRVLIHRIVDYARRRRQLVRFSVTTNGTLIDQNDVAMLRDNDFAVTVSIDGDQVLNDSQRPLKSGGSSYRLMKERLGPLLKDPGATRLGARVTVTGHELNLEQRLGAIVALGFPEVGFSPVRRGSDSTNADAISDWPAYLAEMMALAERELAFALSGGTIRLTNFAVALKQLHKGSCMPYPCSAGGGYFSVAADGTWYACHRAVGQQKFAMGDNDGLDYERRDEFLRSRHVHAQTACRTCWARYLCSGGCHHEASDRNDSSCGFIRGWLDYCIKSHAELLRWRPQWFTA